MREINAITYSLSKSPASIEEKQRKINMWLRYHTAYRVTIDLCSIYGCIQIKVECNGVCLKSWIGTTLENRLNEVISFLGIDKGPTK